MRPILDPLRQGSWSATRLLIAAAAPGAARARSSTITKQSGAFFSTSTHLGYPKRPLTRSERKGWAKPVPKKPKSKRDSNRHRGESTLRRTGVRYRTSVSDEPLPMARPHDKLPPIETDPDHGLWAFFQNRRMVVETPERVEKHGRAWMVEELRSKSWEDLHRLWWVCVKERNQIATAMHEMRDSELGDDNGALKKRDGVVRSTMKAIKHTLTERYYTWEDSRDAAMHDPEIKFNRDGRPVLLPSSHLEDETAEGETEAVEEETEERKVEFERAEEGLEMAEREYEKTKGRLSEDEPELVKLSENKLPSPLDHLIAPVEKPTKEAPRF